MNRYLMAAVALAATLQAGSTLAQTAPATPDAAAPPADAPAAAPQTGTTHTHRHHHHKAVVKNGFTDKSLPDSTQETPTETRPK